MHDGDDAGANAPVSSTGDRAPSVRGRARRFRNILFSPLSPRGNTAAMRRVEALARRDGADVTAVGIVREASTFQRLLHGAAHVDAVLAEQHRDMERRLERCATSQLDVARIVDVGSPAISLVQRAIGAAHDLLVVTGDDDVDDAIVQRLIRKSPCPVWVIRSTRARRTRVLAAIEPEPDQAPLNRRILDVAASMGGLDDGELHVVNGWELYGESTMQSSAFLQVDPAEIERRRELVRLSHERAVADLLSERSESWRPHVVCGPPERVISDVIARERINLVVMGTHARTGISGLVMGNTAERVLGELRCSVVAVKPPGFVSPIRS